MASIKANAGELRSPERDAFRDFIEKDNVTDLLQDLKKEVIDSGDQWDAYRDEMDHSIERLFDDYAKINKTTVENYIKNGQTDLLLADLQKQIDRNSYIKKSLESIKNITQTDTAIALNQLEIDIFKNSLTSSTTPSSTGIREKEFFGDPTDSNNDASNNTGNYHNDYLNNGINPNKIWMDAMYKEGYTPKTDIYGPGYQDRTKHLENIYNDRKIRRVMEKIFDNESQLQLKRGTFRLNLSKEDGLGFVILDLAKKIENKNNPKLSNKKDSVLLQDLYKSTIDPTTKKSIVTGFHGFTPEIIKQLFPSYSNKNAGDEKRIAKILNNASREDLYTFATLLESRSDISTTVKEWNNSLEITGNSRRDKAGDQESLVVAGKWDAEKQEYVGSNVLFFLCDFNSDNAISGAPIDLDNRKKQLNRKTQKNQGDVGNIFGQQLLFSIEQAIKVSDAKLEAEFGEEPPYRGENIVIQNIIKNISIADRRKRPALDQKLSLLIKDPSLCTIPKLSDLIHEHPEFKQLFRSGIEKINGGAEALSPDLLETLTGTDIIEMVDTINEEVALKNQIDNAIKHNPHLRELIAQQGLVYVRNTIFTSIMSVLDNLTITTTDNSKDSYIRNGGIEKGREIQRIKKMLLQQVVHNLVTAGIHGDANNIRLSLGFAKYGQSPSGKTKRGFAINAGPHFDLSNGDIAIVLNVGGDVAWQYNYKKVINANLDSIKSAKYLGVEARALAGVELKQLGVSVEAGAGIQWLQDPVTGINQINRQYSDLSGHIFDIADSQNIVSLHNISSAIDANIKRQQTSKNYGKFLEQNKSHFEANKQFILSFLEHNNIIQTLADKTPEEKKLAINNLIHILQSGNIEQWRHDLIANLHGKIDLTKLSFGVTSSMLGRRRTQAPDIEGSNQYGDVDQEGSNQYGDVADTGLGGTGSNTGTGIGGAGARTGYTNRLAVAGAYVSARISTWRNHYVPQEKQRLMAQSQIEGGLGEDISFKSASLETYAKYIQGLYNTTNIKVTHEEGKIVIKTHNIKTPIWQYLNIHARIDTPDTEDSVGHNYLITENKVIIGNVGDLGTYTVAEGDGVRRFLVIGSQGTANTELVTQAYSPTKEIKDPETSEIIDTTTGEDAIDVIAQKKETNRALKKDEIVTLIENPALPASTQALLKKSLTNKGEIKDTKGNIYPIIAGTIHIVENLDGTLVVSYAPDISKDASKVSIVYDKALEKSKQKTTTVQANFDTKFLHYETGSSLYTTIETYLNNEKFRNSIMEAENGQEKLYKKFLSVIDNDLMSAKDTIISLLTPLKSKAEVAAFIGFIQVLAKKKDVESLSVALDGIKTILALEPGYANMSIGQLLGKRKDTFTTLTGPAKQTFPPAIATLRDQWAKDTKLFTSQEKRLVPNLIGYTAFYRYEQGDHRKFSLTAPGSTRILGDYIQEIPTQNKKEAENRFLSNLEKNPHEYKLVKKAIEARLRTKYPNISLNADNIKDLITTGKSKLTIDNKDINVILNSSFVFYLLGECANESLGLIIKDITVEQTDIYDSSVSQKVETAVQKETGYDLAISAEAHSVAMRVQTQELRAGYAHHQRIPARSKSTLPPGDDEEGGNQYTEDDPVVDDEGGNQYTVDKPVLDGGGDGGDNEGGNQGTE